MRKKYALTYCCLILFQLKSILSLLHTEISIGNKIVYSYFEQINRRIYPINDEEVNMTNLKINLYIEKTIYQKQYMTSG